MPVMVHLSLSVCPSVCLFVCSLNKGPLGDLKTLPLFRIMIFGRGPVFRTFCLFKD